MQFAGSITDSQANAIIGAMWKWFVDDLPFGATPQMESIAASKVAAVVCDAVHEDITLQPLHEAYGRKRGYSR